VGREISMSTLECEFSSGSDIIIAPLPSFTWLDSSMEGRVFRSLRAKGLVIR